MAFQYLKLDSAEGVVVLTIQRESVLNALNTATLEELEKAIDQVRDDPDARALIITGAGDKAFVAGADISEMRSMSVAAARRYSGLGHRLLAQMESLSVPTIAAVNGFALGGGCELAMACDVIYASERAKFGQPEVKLGVIPGFGGTQRLLRLVGRMRAKEMVFSGDIIDARAAKEFGLALEVLPHDQLMPYCREIARKFASRSPIALAQAKRVMEWGADADLRTANEIERQAFAMMFGTEDLKEGMAAFLEKRTAVFRGR